VNIQIIAPALPPVFDAIGDYTAHLSSELAKSARVEVLVPHSCKASPVQGVQVRPAFDATRRSGVREIARIVESTRPDWVVLQFNQFSYGKWGLNLHLPMVMKRIKRRCPGTRIAFMAHEDFVPLTTWKFAVMTTWQRCQFKALGSSADLVLFSIESWAKRYRSWFSGKPVLHLPVGSNIPLEPIDRVSARERLGILRDQTVFGIFGTFRDAGMVEMMRRAVLAVKGAGHSPLVLYIGPHGGAVCDALGDSAPIIADGPLESDEVSRRFAAMDIYMAPYIDGASTRRGALMAGIQHGVPTIGTSGVHTDSVLSELNGRAVLLADVEDQDLFNSHAIGLSEDPELRKRIGQGGARLYEKEFTWKHIAGRLLSALS
jgi:glycosyltransferase involved in cell wall biosynthesis